MPQKPSAQKRTKDSEGDPLLALAGSGKELWADEHADVYVERLRGYWQPVTGSEKPIR